ncbi:MAG: NADAR family protein [Chitinophaga sp.]|uniref:NADAR family protein n=1 Tax=Chitinophaga sp. TaxID=1869181 RepID=UPI0025B851FC|nr:NADAR family protein [Chitinophaga sp.]MBV8253510.1 NADAR family protein [Chitinophaga sp.]
MLTKTLLIQSMQQGEKFKFLCFWGHTPKSNTTTDKSCFSQWFPSPFTVDGILYPTAEHWMMAGKARLFNDPETLEKILVATSPAAAKKLGRQVANFDAATWDQHAPSIVRDGNIHKFGQNPDLLTFLLNTNNRVLVEASPYDAIWGIGLEASHPHAEQPEKWKGDNLLGFALMDARSYLQKKGYSHTAG